MMIDIIGAGIGGLTMAIALEQKGIKVRVFEQATEIKPVGAGIILANNAMQVYGKLGLKKTIEEKGNYISSMNITKANLNTISKVDLSFFEKKYKVKTIAIHRGALQQVLIDKLRFTKIYLNHHLNNIEQNSNGCLLVFEEGKKVQSSVVIGADGIKSVVRQSLFPKTMIRNANQICWRGIANVSLPEKYNNEANEAWGKKNRFGFVELSKNKVYWYALKSYSKNNRKLKLSDIETYFSEYNSIVHKMIRATKEEEINTSEMLDLKPMNNWYKKKVCLIGDAAHATTPNMGQGACQAIVDAYVVSECLTKNSIDDAFKEFQKTRLSTAHQIVKSSWMIGKIAHISNPFLIRIRNLSIKLMPSFINKKQLEQIFKIPNI